MINRPFFGAVDQTLKALARQNGRAATLSQIQKAYPAGGVDTCELCQDLQKLQEAGLAQAQASVPPRFFLTLTGLEKVKQSSDAN